MPTKVHTKIKKSPDFELHLRTVREEGVEVIELRDYVPSEKWYGRGIQIEKHQLQDVISALRDLARYQGGSAAGGNDTHAARIAADADANSPTLPGMERVR